MTPQNLSIFEKLAILKADTAVQNEPTVPSPITPDILATVVATAICPGVNRGFDWGKSKTPDGNAVTNLKHCISRKVVPVSVADVARLQVAPQELPNSGESGYPKDRHGVARMGWQLVSKRFSASFAVAPSGQRRDGLWPREMSRFGASHGCDYEPWLAPKRLSIRFYLIKNPSRRCRPGLAFCWFPIPMADAMG